ncbi:MAG: DNA mismatch repair endonuclease MutL [Candidatus Thorarchaeota archaeon]
MGRIRPLDQELVSLISAGEVIEGPFSVVKELIENALDAGATMIDVAIEEGGIKKISVSDNGHGILHEDCAICLERHSTSKIRSREDIEAIGTYGFRGEALASMAAVAEMRIITRAKEEDIGTEVISRPGARPTIREASRPVGSTVEVMDLFARIPARRKHLAGPKVEAQRVIDVVMRHAAVRNDVGFRLVRDGEVVLECPRGQRSEDRLLYLWGSQISRALVRVDHSRMGVRVTGFVVRPPYSRGNRSREYFSVLKRPIEDQRLSRAVENGYSTLLMRGRYPACLIDIEVDLRDVDVNVHPTKREVRMSNMDTVLRVVEEAVRRALSQDRPPDVSADLDEYLTTVRDGSHETHVAAFPPTRQPNVTTAHPRLTEEVPLAGPSPRGPPTEPAVVDELGGTFRIVGQIHNLYILLEFEDALVIIDQHAAHERVMYERLRKEVNEGHVSVQELLEPMVVQMGPDEVHNLLSLSDMLQAVGFDIGPFGDREIVIRAVPEILGRHARPEDLTALVDELVEVGSRTPTEHFMDEIVKVTACHSAIRAGRPLNEREIRGLLEEMAETPNRYNCPHGRPTMIRISSAELERRFKRTT